MGDEAEQDTNDQGKCPSKFLLEGSGSQPGSEQFFALMLLCMLSFNPLWERTKTQKKLCAQKHGMVVSLCEQLQRSSACLFRLMRVDMKAVCWVNHRGSYSVSPSVFFFILDSCGTKLCLL